jgi:hypothetical protein
MSRASFYTTVNRLQQQQNVEGAELKARLGIDVTQEAQNIDAAQRSYQEQTDRASLEMARNERKRSKWGLGGTLIGFASSFANPIGAIGGALIGGLVSGLGRSSVKPYSGTIANTLPGGDFHNEARMDLSSSVDATNSFISDAVQGQNLLNWTNALSDAVTTYQLGKEVPSMKEGFRDWAVGKPTGGELDSEGNLIGTPTYEGGRSKEGSGLFQGKFGEKMRKNQLPKYKEKLMNEKLKRMLLGEGEVA